MHKPARKSDGGTTKESHIRGTGRGRGRPNGGGRNGGGRPAGPREGGSAPTRPASTCRAALSLRDIEWLAEVQRNHDFVVHAPPDSLVTSAAGAALGLSQGMCHHEELSYEPRSIAVSQGGTAAAIGTKSGEIRLSRWDGAGQAWRSSTKSLTLPPPSAEDSTPRSPVRALCFLTEQLLVAGWGCGEMTLFDLEKGTACPVPRVVDSESPEPPHGWFDRFTDILSLVPASSFIPNGLVALGITSGYRVHVLIKDGERYRSLTTTPDRLQIETKALGPANARAVRLIGGVWAHERLWLLNSRGVVTCLRRTGIERRAIVDDLRWGYDFPLQVDATVNDKGSFQLKPIREPAEFKEIRGCKLGLAVRVSDDITVVRFAKDPEADAPGLVHPARWEAAPDALDFTVGMPFFDESSTPEGLVQRTHAGGPRYRSPIDKDPLWVVVATEQPGLRWIAWKDDTETGALKPVGGAAPHRAGFPSVTLYVQFGWRKGTSFLVCADRSHKFHIVPLLESRANADLIQRALRKSPGAGARESGIGWWLLSRAIVASIMDGARLPKHVATALEHRDAADLRSLLRRALRAWLRSEHPKRLDALREWLWRLLERAHELGDPELPASLGRQAVDALAASLVPGRSSGNREDAWHEVGLLAGFLRKWLVFGHTYAKSDCALSDLYRLNQDCHENLDALTYVTLLLKQKTDLVWKRRLGRPGASPTHWGLALAEDESFSLHSDAEGKIHAVVGNGQPLGWFVDAAAKLTLDTHGLDTRELVDGGLPYLQHAYAPEYRAEMRRGPYARRILMFRNPARPAEGQPAATYVAVFHFRGLAGSSRHSAASSGQRSDGIGPRRDPRLYAVLFCHDAEHDGLRLLDVRSLCQDGDLYGLAKLDGSAADPSQVVILAGTNGSWDTGLAESPFIELDLKLETDSIQHFAQSATHVPHLSGELGGMPRAAYRPAHNPCWCLVPEQDGSSTWLWTASKDGQIRAYRRDADHGRVIWTPGGGLLESPRNAPLRHRPQRSGFQASSAVWSLHLLRSGVGDSGRPLLAYGTADGVVGVMEVPKPGTIGPPVHVVHTELAAPICGLVDFEEDGTRKLAAVGQNGGVSLFDVGEVLRAPILARRTFGGARLDRFGFTDSARAVAIVKGSEEAAATLIVGTSDGYVHKRHLVACRGSQSRRDLVGLACQLFKLNQGKALLEQDRRSVASMSACVGTDALHQWLRVLDVGGDHLQRFSIWKQLNEAAAAVRLQRDPSSPRATEALNTFLRTLDALSEHAFRRRPFSREAVKILWDVGAHVANLASREALTAADAQRRSTLLEFNASVTRLLEMVANRWISHAPEMESRILMQVFNAVFDWSDVILLSRLDSEAAEITRGNRRFVVESLVARVLDYSDPLVSLEVLRSINDALVLALAKMTEHRWRCGLYPSASGPTISSEDAGWFDVVQLVGNMMSRSHAVLLSSLPLFTQAARFFALSLLLAPEGSLLLLQVISENGLHALDEAIRGHLRASFSQLANEFDVDLPQWRDLETEVRTHFGDLQVTHADSLPPEAAGTLTNEDYRREAVAVGQTLEALKDIHGETRPPWLNRGLHGVHYFKHSYRFMSWVEEQRRKLRPKTMGEKPNECRELLRLLPDVELFEPQRSRYRVIFDNWLNQIGTDAQFAIDNLDLVEGFNRHVYRASADDLLTVASELALQTSPKFPGADSGSLVDEQLKRHPLIHALVERGTRLADSSQLIEIIITIAARRATERGYVKRHGAVSMPALLELIQAVAGQQQLMASRCAEVEAHEHVSVPGSSAIWGAILQEWFKNIWRYGSGYDERGRWLFYRMTKVAHGWRLQLAGPRPFLRDLEPANPKLAERLRAEQEALDQKGIEPSVRAARCEALRELIDKEILKKLGHERGLRYHTRDKHGGSGYGLNLVFKLCGFIGLEPRLCLASPVDLPPPNVLQDPRCLPLCLQVDLPEERGRLEVRP